MWAIWKRWYNWVREEYVPPEEPVGYVYDDDIDD